MSEFEEPSMWNMIWQGRKGGEEFKEYINSLDLEDPEVLDFLRENARNVMSEPWVAINQKPSKALNWKLLDNVLGDLDNYHGQSLSLVGASQYNIDQYNKRYGLQESANLRDVFLGWEGLTPEDEGLYETNLRPGGTKDNWDQSRYPFDAGGEKVYDITPFITLKSIINTEKENYSYEQQWWDGQSLLQAASQLEIGDGFQINKPEIEGTLDLGESNWSIGRDEKGIYLAIADIWDFTGGGQEYGEVLDKLGTPINMYGRIYLDKYDFRPFDPQDWR